jgi:hypothetical protein
VSPATKGGRRRRRGGGRRRRRRKAKAMNEVDAGRDRATRLAPTA